MSGGSDRPGSSLGSFTGVGNPETETPPQPGHEAAQSRAPADGQHATVGDLSGSNYARERRELLNLLANLHRTG